MLWISSTLALTERGETINALHGKFSTILRCRKVDGVLKCAATKSNSKTRYCPNLSRTAYRLQPLVVRRLLVMVEIENVPVQILYGELP